MRIGGSSAQITLKDQFLTVLFRHIFISGLAAVFGIGAFWWFLTKRSTNLLYSCIFTCIYFGMMYVKCSRVAAHDLKGYAETKAYPAKGLVLALPVVVLTLVFDILRLLAWKYSASDAGLVGIPAVACNTVFIVWTFAFNGIMAIERSSVSIVGHILIYVMPALSAFCGYFAGYKRFSLLERLIPFMYEKKSDDEEN